MLTTGGELKPDVRLGLFINQFQEKGLSPIHVLKRGHFNAAERALSIYETPRQMSNARTRNRDAMPAKAFRP